MSQSAAPHARPAADGIVAAIEPHTGWHVSHAFYAFDRGKLAALPAAAAVETALEPCTGWHVTHSFDAFDRGRLAGLSAAARTAGVRE
ncbi:MAG: hypothetical protein ACKON7_00445, partial [Planctomycetaceae bacterium]